jgi:hypothetical protein
MHGSLGSNKTIRIKYRKETHRHDLIDENPLASCVSFLNLCRASEFSAKEKEKLYFIYIYIYIYIYVSFVLYLSLQVSNPPYINSHVVDELSKLWVVTMKLFFFSC